MCKKLEPCPFCGETERLEVITDAPECFVCCRNPECDRMKPSKTGAIKAWNTRKASKPIGVDEARLKLIWDYLAAQAFDQLDVHLGSDEFYSEKMHIDKCGVCQACQLAHEIMLSAEKARAILSKLTPTTKIDVSEKKD